MQKVKKRAHMHAPGVDPHFGSTVPLIWKQNSQPPCHGGLYDQEAFNCVLIPQKWSLISNLQRYQARLFCPTSRHYTLRAFREKSSHQVLRSECAFTGKFAVEVEFPSQLLVEKFVRRWNTVQCDDDVLLLLLFAGLHQDAGQPEKLLLHLVR
jgi:hypothetical protein